MTANEPGATTPRQPDPFPRYGKIRKQVVPMTIEQALASAAAAGFRQTARSRPDAAHVQRKWNEGATIRPVPGGVVVQPAWTSGQLIAVAVVVAGFFLLVVCPSGSALIAA